MRRLIFRAAPLAALLFPLAAAGAAPNFVVKDGNAALITKCSVPQADGAQADCNVLVDTAGAKIDPATKALQQQQLATLGAPSDAKSIATDTTAASHTALLKGIIDRLSALIAASAASPQAGAKVDTVVAGAAADRGLVVATAGAATPLMAADPARRGFAIQNQSSGACYLNAAGPATQDQHSLLIAGGSYFESKDSHVATGALSILCAVANAPVYARSW
ncbi:hypothetical protein [Sphingomonas morindae]|uniref:Uncharacterized protein n=1 Tax=Sphingomonas morindae TaxID=1541170 RepID=A0ABY4X727_9SPHN|nr:hypothetical protein [Sphingomonas morindae]USI72706.1 hypothetical protein LHA26_15750 [Sphingomonas morindae]